MATYLPSRWATLLSAVSVAALTTFNASAQSVSAPLTVGALAGVAGQRQATDGTGTAARFYSPGGIAIDASGNLIVADTSNNIFRKVTPAGVVTTFSGSAITPDHPINIGSSDGSAGNASFHIGEFTTSGSTWDPPIFTIVGSNTLGIDAAGNIYLADTLSNTIRKIAADGSVVTIAGAANQQGSADGSGGNARFLVPAGVATDSAGNIYVADSGNSTIRKITPAGVVSTFAGTARAFGSTDATGAAARFNNPSGVAVDSSGNVYVTDTGNHTIRKITSNGVVTTLAGMAGTSGISDGSGTAARFNGPTGIAVDSSGNVYVADTGNNAIRKISPAGTVGTIAGSKGNAGYAEGTGTAALFNQPYGITIDAAGAVYIADTGNNLIRKGVGASGSGSLVITTVPPSTVQANTGATITLKVGATGSPAPSYQWSKDDAPISGATSGTLTLNSVTSANNGNYSVAVTSGSITFTSSYTDVKVYPPSSPLPSVTIVTQPADRVVASGQSTTFTVEATSSQSLIYQWLRFDGPIAGATSPTYTINSAQSSDAGVYKVRITDGNTTVTTTGATLTVSGGTPVNPPVFSTQPASQTITVGGTASFTVAASGSPVFQWQKDGTPISNSATVSGASTAILTITNATLADAGNYSAIATNAGGSATSAAATLTVNNSQPTGPTAWLVNVSVRTTMVANQDPLIVGLTTNDQKDILVRGVGPGLANYGVSGVLADPSLQLYPLGSSTVVASNNDWNSSLAPVAAAVGAFPLTAGSKDAALVQTVKGGYSVWELATGAGTVLVETYDTNPNYSATRLTNLSARNRVGTGSDILIAGFAVQGTGTKKLLIRAIGPKLADYGVSGTLADPKLEIYQGTTKIAENDSWDASLATTFGSVGAFQLTAGSKDAAIIVDLPAGVPPATYTAQVKGSDGGTGVALIEVYEVP